MRGLAEGIKKLFKKREDRRVKIKRIEIESLKEPVVNKIVLAPVFAYLDTKNFLDKVLPSTFTPVEARVVVKPAIGVIWEVRKAEGYFLVNFYGINEIFPFSFPGTKIEGFYEGSILYEVRIYI